MNLLKASTREITHQTDLITPEFGDGRVHDGGPLKRRMQLLMFTGKHSKGLPVNSLRRCLRPLAVNAVLLLEGSYTQAAFLPADKLEVTTAHSKLPFTLIHL